MADKDCAKCGTSMTPSRAVGTMGKFAAAKEPLKSFTTKESSILRPYVCSNCGYVEWYVDQPAHFRHE